MSDDWQTVVRRVQDYLHGATRTGETVRLSAGRIERDLGIDRARVGRVLGRIEREEIDADCLEVGRWSDRSDAATWEIDRS